MGKTLTPKYRMILDGQVMAWNCKEYGKPTDNNLSKFVFKYADSLKLGGVNQHISLGLGYVPFPIWARIETNTVMPTIIAKWESGKFQVF